MHFILKFLIAKYGEKIARELYKQYQAEKYKRGPQGPLNGH